jgi:PAS domain S-box-containing protein
MGKTLRLLMAEDSEDDSLLLLRELRRGGYQVEFERVETPSAMKAALGSQEWDIVISDYAMPQFSAPQALAVLKETSIDLPFLIVSGTIGEEKAVAALLAGAHDFISKENMARLIPAVERELRESAVRRAKRESEIALRESEARYRLLFDNNPLPLWVYDLETLAFLTVNAAAINHYGYSEAEFLSMTIKDIWLEDYIPSLLDDLSQVGSGSNQAGVWQHCKKDGSVIDVEVTAHNLEFGSRRARLVLSSDITERKRAEENLHRYNQRLKTLHAIDQAILSAQSLEIVCQFALAFITSQMTPWEASITVFDPKIEEGILFTTYNPDEQQWPEGKQISLQTFPKAAIESLREGNIYLADEEKDHSLLPPGIADMQGQALQSYVIIPLIAQDTLIGSLNLGAAHLYDFKLEAFEMPREVADQLAIAIQQARFRDEIQRHAAELEQRVFERTVELQRTKDRTETILNNSSDAIILSSFDGVVQQINPAFSELFGYSTDEIFGQSLLTLVSPDQVEVLLKALAAVVNTGKPSRVEVVATHRDGTLFDVDFVMAAILQENKIRDVVCGLRDITERKQMEQGLRAALEKEKELSELKSRFSSMVSHEFRTPLAVILSSVGLLQRYSERMSVEKREEHLGQIQIQVGHLVGLLDDVLSLSRAETLGIEITADILDLTTFCSGVVAEIQQTTQKHEIVFSIVGNPVPVALDMKLMRQVITNLLSNAIKYSPNGGSVKLNLIYQFQEVFISIQDEGIGIPEADQKRLFEVFHRAVNVGNIPGTGLGLPIVKRAVEAHGGTISVESQISQGTTFIIRIPIEPNSLEA